LQNLAAPLEEKADEAFAKALAKGHELAIYNSWTSLAKQKLDELHPTLEPPAPVVAYLGSESVHSAPLQKDVAPPQVRSVARPTQKQARLEAGQ